MNYSAGYNRLSPLSTLLVLRVGITRFSVQMATQGVANRFSQHGLHIAQSIATYIILSEISVFGTSVQRMNFEIIFLLPRNTLGGITTYIECPSMPTPRQPNPNSCHAIFIEDSTCFEIFHELLATSQCATSSI
jgi:hypothetical protein